MSSETLIKTREKRETLLKQNLEILSHDGWKQHPRFLNYVANKEGLIMHAISKVVSLGSCNQDGYNIVQPSLDSKQWNISRQSFVFECFHGLYNRKTHQIDHINNRRDDNRLDNLQKLTLKEHGEKTKKTISKTRASSNQRPIICIETAQRYDSVSHAAKILLPDNHKTAGKGLAKVLSGDRKRYMSLSWKYDQVEDLGGEIWKKITTDVIFDSTQISSFGRIKLKTGKITEGSVYGETRVTITNSKKQHRIFSVHYLVCRAFHGDPPGTWESDRISVNHKNFFHDDNNADNLEWSNPALQAIHKSSKTSWKISNSSILRGAEVS